MTTIFSVISSGAVSALSFSSRNVRLFDPLTTVSVLGQVLLDTATRRGTTQPGGLRTSIQMVMLEIGHDLRCEYEIPDLVAETTLNFILLNSESSKNERPVATVRQLDLIPQLSSPQVEYGP